MLAIKDLAYWYDKQPENILFENVSLQFETGKMIAIVGKSGSGKTTLLSLISGLDVPKQGQVVYKDKVLTKSNLTTFRKHDVAIVFQAYNLLTYLSAYQNVQVAMEISGHTIPEREKHIRKLLASVGIDETMQDKKVTHLSGGQQQRVAIARALAADSDLIVADEPTGNLDEETSQEIVNLFKSIAHEQNKTVILVTHDQDVTQQADVAYELAQKTLKMLKK
ncbi:ABC transporter ATP-binding protein [Lactococcus formosensis]|uniref:ABC transporter ATP-binding protein n=1 Tax=Lactococcus formosensis TaxID=1281486 RepID=UPI00324827B9